MEIKTKFKIGDSVWYVGSNKAMESEVIKIMAEVTQASTKIQYVLRSGLTIIATRPEEEIFATKEELLKSF